MDSHCFIIIFKHIKFYLLVRCLQTFNADAQIGESSACATALMCGVKTNFETVGLDARGKFENCFSSFQSRVSSLIDWAQQSGKTLFFTQNKETCRSLLSLNRSTYSIKRH